MTLFTSVSLLLHHSAAFECQEEVATYLSKDDLANLLIDLTALSPDFTALTTGAIVPALQNGVQVRKICGSCADFFNQDLCPESVYGFDVPHSGLLISPLSSSDNDNETAIIAPGTNMLNLHFHGVLRHPQAAPSAASWPPNIFVGAGFDIFLGLVYSGTTGTFTLL